jgi:hypothetical protein
MVSNVAYIELDIPKYKLKPEMLQLLPNIEYTNTDTKRLCGLISLRPLTGPIELLSDYHTLVET